MTLDERMQSDLGKREEKDLLRSLLIIQGKVDFSSNDYLGFAQDSQLKKNILTAIQNLRKLGATGSRLLTGNHSLIEKTEVQIAQFHDADTALFFNSGYEANSGLLSTIPGRHDTILYDELSHASLREGIRLSHAHAFSFRHNDTSDLERKLSVAEGEKFIVIESVYSMDGDLSPLEEIQKIASAHSAHIILDEAHATGVIGEKGQGLAQSLGLQSRIFARVHTFGKAIGFNGAAVLGSGTLKQYLVNFCRPFIYTTAPGLMQIVAVNEAYKFLSLNANRVSQLLHNCEYFRQRVSRYPHIRLIASDSAVFSVLLPGNEHARLAAKYIQNGGHDVRPILSPTVPAGSERLRICMHAFNTENEIDRLVKLLDQIILSIRDDE